MSNKFITYGNLERILQKLGTILAKKQDKLISSANIKTINGESLLGYGDIDTNKSPLPDYWMDYIEAKAIEINALNANGIKGETFIFLADTHYPDNNNGHAIEIINELVKRTSIRKVIWAGDIVANLDTPTKMADELRRVSKEFDIDLEVHPLRGNHETDGGLSANQYWDAQCRKISNFCNVDGNIYYYRDDNATKIRYIMTDFVAPESELTEDERKQIEWVKEKILELEAGWTVLVVTHGFFDTQSVGKVGKALVDALDEVYDRSKASIIGVMSGHGHADMNNKMNKGYIGVATLADNANACGAVGTTQEQSFEVVNIDLETGAVKTIRIGKGNNRSFSYKVFKDLPVTNIEVDNPTVFVGEGRKRPITAVLTPNNTANKQVTWKINSGSENATIEDTGLTCEVTGVAAGDVVVEVTSKDGDYKATCNVEVVKLSETDLTSQFTWTTGNGLAWSHGGLTSGSVKYSNSNFIDISAYDEIEFKVYSTNDGGAVSGWAFYDENQTYITGTKIPFDPYGYFLTTQSIVPPENAKYFRTSWYVSANISEFSCKGLSIVK